MKKSCLTWLAAYLLLAAAIGTAVYRRLPATPAVIGSAVFGGFAAMMGFGYLIGIRRKIAEAMMISRARSGEPPRDGQRIAAIGHISPSGSALVSPLSRTSCVAYKYEIRSGGENEAKLYEGFGLNPSAIQSTRGTIRLLAYPDLKIPQRTIPSSEARPNAEEYIRSTQFRELGIDNLRAAFKEMMKDYLDDDGTIRTDQRLQGVGVQRLDGARFVEWIVKPGDEVCAIGLYSAQRGGLVPDPKNALEQVVISEGPPEGFTGRAIRGAIGYLIGGILFLGAVIIGLTALYAVVPLEAREQMPPPFTPTWQEIRLEHEIERRLRVPLRENDLLAREMVPLAFPLGEARGRLLSNGNEVALDRAEATRTNGYTTITMNDGAVVLTIDPKSQPVLFRINGKEIALRAEPTAFDLQVTENNNDEVAGRLTYLSNDLACRVAFRARVKGDV